MLFRSLVKNIIRSVLVACCVVMYSNVYATEPLGEEVGLGLSADVARSTQEKPFTQNIDIAFCFDENLWMQAGVAMTSLLVSSAGKCSYNIHCVISPNIVSCMRRELQDLVERYDANSSIEFIFPNDDFRGARLPEWFTTAIFWRLQLPDLLPNIDRVIYSDVDVIFCGDLSELSKLDFETNLLFAVKDLGNLSKFWENYEVPEVSRGHYVNSGFLLMDLAALRNEKMYDRWKSLSANRYNFINQGIINTSCVGRIGFLPLKYNAHIHSEGCYLLHECIEEGVFTEQDISQSMEDPTVIHMIGFSGKAWKDEVPSHCDRVDHLFWKFAQMTPFHGRLRTGYIIACLQRSIAESMRRSRR